MLNISIPETLARRIDSQAKARHLSRSAFFVQAASEVIERAGRHWTSDRP